MSFIYVHKMCQYVSNLFLLHAAINKQICICRHYIVSMIEIEVRLLLICQTSIVIDRFPTISQT